jgi:hypothetical protein
MDKKLVILSVLAECAWSFPKMQKPIQTGCFPPESRYIKITPDQGIGTLAAGNSSKRSAWALKDGIRGCNTEVAILCSVQFQF